MNDLSGLRFLPEPCSGPCFFRTKMNVSKPADTYLDTRGLHMGMAWLEQQPLGRFWSIGPQYALYMPGPWLKPGGNTITFFDLTGDPSDQIKTSKEPIFGATTSTRD
jgi:beta-galactosidase